MSIDQQNQRSNPHGGIAISPILFVVAILAILAAGVAAGSGSFGAGTASASDHAKASALIGIGENLKMGMERLTMKGGLAPAAVDLDPAHTTQSNALFSPAGGGVTPPPVSMALHPQSDRWSYVTEAIKGFGTDAPEIFAVLRVSPGVCAEINDRAVGRGIEPDPQDLGDFTAPPSSQTHEIEWPTDAATGFSLQGLTMGCVNNANPGSSGDYFYQMLSVE